MDPWLRNICTLLSVNSTKEVRNDCIKLIDPWSADGDEESQSIRWHNNINDTSPDISGGDVRA